MCSEEYVDVYEGNSISGNPVASYTGNADFSLSSTGTQMYIHFRSTSTTKTGTFEANVTKGSDRIESGKKCWP